MDKDIYPQPEPRDMPTGERERISFATACAHIALEFHRQLEELAYRDGLPHLSDVQRFDLTKAFVHGLARGIE